MSDSGTDPITPAASAAAAAAEASASAVMHAIKHKGERVCLANFTAYIVECSYGMRQAYPVDIWYFLASTVGVAAILNIASVIWAFWRRRSTQRSYISGDVPASKTNGICARLANCIVTGIRIVALRWRIPTIRLSILEAFLTSMYLMALLIWTFVNSEVVSLPRLSKPLIVLFVIAQQLNITDWSDRSGHIAGSQIPLIVGLSMKNNIIGCKSP